MKSHGSISLQGFPVVYEYKELNLECYIDIAENI